MHSCLHWCLDTCGWLLGARLPLCHEVLCSEATEAGKSSLEIDPHIASVYTKALEGAETRFHAIINWLKVRSTCRVMPRAWRSACSDSDRRAVYVARSTQVPCSPSAWVDVFRLLGQRPLLTRGRARCRVTAARAGL